MPFIEEEEANNDLEVDENKNHSLLIDKEPIHNVSIIVTKPTVILYDSFQANTVLERIDKRSVTINFL